MKRTADSLQRSHALAALLALTFACHHAAAQDLKSELKAQAPLARTSGVAAAANGKFYFIGGLSADDWVGAVHEFDPVVNSWSTKTAMPTPRASAAAVELDGRIYVLGGRRDDSILTTVERYDPAGDTWSTLPPMPTARWHLMAAVVDGKIYALGGIAGVGNARRVLDVIEVYDAVNDNWSALSPMPLGNSNAGVAVIGARIFIVGGRLKAGADSGGATSKLSIYDTATGKWETGPSMNQERTGLEACALDGTVYAIGGASRGTYTATVEVLRPNADKWILKEALRTPRTDHNCAVLGGKMYLVGGFSAPSIDAILASCEELSPVVR